MSSWQQFLSWIKDNKDALGWLFGSGVVLAVLGGLFKLVTQLFNELRMRKTRSDQDFPFKVIAPNSDVAKEILGGEENDLLADRNIPYQHRVSRRSIRREIEDLLSQHQWVLIAGKTGLGKTREAINVAEGLNREGWTVLYLTRERWLSPPSRLPSGVPERRLLFILDDLNRKIHASRVEQSPRAAENVLEPLTVPLQIRLFETLRTFESLCGKNEVLVIATARNEKFTEFVDEPSEWDKLDIKKYSDFWNRFTFFELPEAEYDAEISLLSDTTRIANIKSDASEFAVIAKRNDGTFANLVENLRTVRNKNTYLKGSAFRDTLKGTWEKRYKDAIARYPFAKYIYDSVEVARAVNIKLSFRNIFEIANIIAGKDPSRFNVIVNILTLIRLTNAENILNPRDGQIEAKGYRIDLQKYISKLYLQIAREYYSRRRFLSRLHYFYFIVSLTPKRYFSVDDELSAWYKIFTLFNFASSALNSIGLAYDKLNFPEHAILFYTRSIELAKWQLAGRGNSRHNQTIRWNNLGIAYHNLKRYDDAIKVHKKVIEFNPEAADSYYHLASVYRSIRQYDDAIMNLKKVVDLNPEDTRSWVGLAHTYSMTNDLEKALQCFEKASMLSPLNGSTKSSMAQVLKKLGRIEEANQQIAIALTLMEKASEYNRARLEAICGNIEDALKLLRIAINKRQTSFRWISQDPDFENLHADPRFKEFIDEYEKS